MASSAKTFALPTQRQIASALGISQATVAIALNPRSSKRLPEETILRIRSKADELGYRPHRSAQVMRQQRSHTVGVLFQSAAFQTHSDRIRLISQEFHRKGYHLIAADVDWFERNPETIQAYFLDAAVEGMVLSNIQVAFPPDWLQPFLQRSVKVVTMGMNSWSAQEPLEDYSADMEAAFYHLTRHHLAIGSRRLVLLLRPRYREYKGELSGGAKSRIRGFVRAMREAGGSVLTDEGALPLIGMDLPGVPEGQLVFKNSGSPEGIVSIAVREQLTGNLFEAGRQCSEELLRALLPPDSLICSNDHLALGAIGTCLNLGLSIPEQIRISGADETPFSANHVVPITSIRQPVLELAKAASLRLVEQLDGIEASGVPHPPRIPCEVIVRESTCNAGTAFRLADEGMFNPPPDQTRFTVSLRQR